MSSPDIFLAAGDTGPVTVYTLNDANAADGSAGGAMDLTGASVVVRYQPKNRSVAMVQRPAPVLGDPTLGQVEVDWGLNGGPPAVGNYNLRFVATLSDGHIVSFPNGDRNLSNGGESFDADDDSFFWLQVAPDFAAVP
jgi:hypothetical protein